MKRRCIERLTATGEESERTAGISYPRQARGRYIHPRRTHPTFRQAIGVEYQGGGFACCQCLP